MPLRQGLAAGLSFNVKRDTDQWPYTWEVLTLAMAECSIPGGHLCYSQQDSAIKKLVAEMTKTMVTLILASLSVLKATLHAHRKAAGKHHLQCILPPGLYKMAAPAEEGHKQKLTSEIGKRISFC